MDGHTQIRHAFNTPVGKGRGCSSHREEEQFCASESMERCFKQTMRESGLKKKKKKYGWGVFNTEVGSFHHSV